MRELLELRTQLSILALDDLHPLAVSGGGLSRLVGLGQDTLRSPPLLVESHAQLLHLGSRVRRRGGGRRPTAAAAAGRRRAAGGGGGWGGRESRSGCEESEEPPHGLRPQRRQSLALRSAR